MDTKPFLRINSCGVSGLEVTQVSELGGPHNLLSMQEDFREVILKSLNFNQFEIGEFVLD
jgi:lipoyl(octanoyl) transferase